MQSPRIRYAVTRNSPRRRVALLAAALVLFGTAVQADGWQSMVRSDVNVLVDTTTRMKDFVAIGTGGGLASAGMDMKISSIVKRFPIDPTALGYARAKGTAVATFACFATGGREELGRRTVKFDRYGNAAATVTAPGGVACTFFEAVWSFKGSQKQPANTALSAMSVAQLLVDGADPECRDLDTLCLGQDSRFRVEVEWRTSSRSGSGVPLASGFDAGTFYFFDPESTDLLVQLLNGCSSNNRFWVFARATTGVGYDLTVTDTTTDQVRTYSNPLGQAAQPITDTSAFATCP